MILRSRRAFLLTAFVAVPQRRRLTKTELQQQLKAAILEAVRDSNAEIAEAGLATIDNWSKRGADRLVTDQSEPSLKLAAANAQRCGKAIGDAARATPDHTATRDVILAVFGRLCPIYPFC